MAVEPKSKWIVTKRLPIGAFLIAGCLGASGCTVAGVAMGAAMPRYEPTEWPRSNVELGTQVRVRTRNIGADFAGASEVAGRYGGTREGLLSVTDEEEREHEIPTRDIVDLQVRSGTEWKKGLLVGAAADTVLLLTVLAVTHGANVSVVTGQ